MPTHRHHIGQKPLRGWLPVALKTEAQREAARRGWNFSEFVRYALARALGYSESQARLGALVDSAPQPARVRRPAPRARPRRPR